MSRKNMIKGILFLAIACMIFVAGQRKSNNIIQQNLKSNLIRFHVRANSNSRMDQTYKLKVRDAVIDQISPELSEAKTKEEAFKILKMQKNRIKNTAQEILKKEGVKQKVNGADTDRISSILSSGIYSNGFFAEIRSRRFFLYTRNLVSPAFLKYSKVS